MPSTKPATVNTAQFVAGLAALADYLTLLNQQALQAHTVNTARQLMINFQLALRPRRTVDYWQAMVTRNVARKYR